MQAQLFDFNRDEYSYGIASGPYGFVAMSFSTDSTTNNWAVYDSTTGIYYRTAGVLKLSNELRDSAATSTASGITISSVSSAWI